MFNIIRKEIEWAGKKLTLETGKIARQADGAVIATYGETSVLCTVVAQKTPDSNRDFFPLTVHYKEMSFAAGKIPGGFFKREGKPSEKEVLTSRLIDRPIRPLFPTNFFNEVQIICTVLSYDGINDSDIVALIGASAALSISGVPFGGPIAASRVALIDDQFVINPAIKDLALSSLDLVVAGTKDSVLMVESEASELSEEKMLEAVVFGHNAMQPIIQIINELSQEVNKPLIPVIHENDSTKLDAVVAVLIENELREALKEPQKQLRAEKIQKIKSNLKENQKIKINLGTEGTPHEEFLEAEIVSAFNKLKEQIVRNNILEKGIRIDGRDPKTIRPIATEVEVLARTHGSSLFTRGETQAIVVTTLGSAQDEQIIDSLDGDSKLHFMLHYNFPPYSVGEHTPVRAPGRREIGHGKLAWRAIHPLLPTKDKFPYTIRCVSEITESNGSSSMATVCGASLALMDAGVPIKNPVAGIAMGLVKEGEKFVVLSDIMGDEDHLGDMDFKVAGTAQGITALQMDIKINGITPEIMQISLNQAKEGRLHILEKMSESLTQARNSVSKNAPTITSFTINKDKIREVIGSGGKVIREICEVSGAKIDIDDNGVISVSAVNAEASAKAIKMINDIVAEAEIGTIYDGKVVKLMEFGAFVNFLGSKDGLLHISEIKNERINDVSEVLKEGDNVKVKVIGLDKGKVRLSMKCVDQTTGEDLDPDFIPTEPKPSNNKSNKKFDDRSNNKKKFF
jgi:polyribonucleotide nucleotidyltransferase